MQVTLPVGVLGLAAGADAENCQLPQFPHQEKGDRMTLGGSSLPDSGVQTPGVPPKSPQMQSA